MPIDKAHLLQPVNTTVGLLDRKDRVRAIVKSAAQSLKSFPSLEAALREDSRGVFERRAEDLLTVAENHPLASTLTADQVNAEVSARIKFEVLSAEINRSMKRTKS